MLLMLESTNASTDAFSTFVLSICRHREQYLTLAINYVNRAVTLEEQGRCGDIQVAISLLGHTEQNALSGISNKKRTWRRDTPQYSQGMHTIMKVTSTATCD